jgi:arginine:ornithine antiporter/lysine permease
MSPTPSSCSARYRISSPHLVKAIAGRILGASVVLWLIHALILSGVRQAAFVNLLTTVAKIAPIVLFIAIAFLAFKIDIFSLDFSGAANVKLGSITDQVKSTMLVTLWVFIGIEGASVVSGRAERRKISASRQWRAF